MNAQEDWHGIPGYKEWLTGYGSQSNFIDNGTLIWKSSILARKQTTSGTPIFLDMLAVQQATWECNGVVNIESGEDLSRIPSLQHLSLRLNLQWAMAGHSPGTRCDRGCNRSSLHTCTKQPSWVTTVTTYNEAGFTWVYLGTRVECNDPFLRYCNQAMGYISSVQQNGGFLSVSELLASIHWRLLSYLRLDTLTTTLRKREQNLLKPQLSYSFCFKNKVIRLKYSKPYMIPLKRLFDKGFKSLMVSLVSTDHRHFSHCSVSKPSNCWDMRSTGGVFATKVTGGTLMAHSLWLIEIGKRWQRLQISLREQNDTRTNSCRSGTVERLLEINKPGAKPRWHPSHDQPVHSKTFQGLSINPTCHFQCIPEQIVVAQFEGAKSHFQRASLKPISEHWHWTHSTSQIQINASFFVLRARQSGRIFW